MQRRLAAILAADMVGYSRLMEADELGVLVRQKALRRDVIDVVLAENSGRIVKTTGDGLLVDFPSAIDAVRSALSIQSGLRDHESGQTEDTRIQYRIGVNVGDMIFDEEDVFGDGVNVAARLESMAEPGGVCISDAAYQIVGDHAGAGFKDLGAQRIKNISRLIRVWQWVPEQRVDEVEIETAALTQSIRFCASQDGTQIAYAKIGQGPLILKAPNWLSHLDYEWRSPIWKPLLSGFAERFELLRFDQRGGGLSDWDVDVVSDRSMIADMQAVVSAAQAKRFALFGLSQGCPFSVRYAVENPDKVSCMILAGGYARGVKKRNAPDQEALFDASQTMVRQGWGSPNPHFRSFFTNALIPDASPEQQAGFDELQRVAASAENAVRINEMNGLVDISDLARQVQVPTLVLHCAGDRRVPPEEGRRLAALIPGARFVSLPGNNHVLLEGTPEFHQFFEEVGAFLKEHHG